MRNPRQYQPDEWVDFALEGVAESLDATGIDVDHTDALDEIVADYSTAVTEALEDCSTKFPPKQEIPDDAQTEHVIFSALSGEGLDGRWDDYYDDAQIKDVTDCLRSHLGFYVDDTGGGRIQDAMYDAVYRAKQAAEEEEGDDDDEDDEDESTSLDEDLALINEHRRSLWMAPLDPEAAGFTRKDIAELADEVRARRHRNPCGDLLCWNPGPVDLRSISPERVVALAASRTRDPATAAWIREDREGTFVGLARQMLAHPGLAERAGALGLTAQDVADEAARTIQVAALTARARQRRGGTERRRRTSRGAPAQNPTVFREIGSGVYDLGGLATITLHHDGPPGQRWRATLPDGGNAYGRTKKTALEAAYLAVSLAQWGEKARGPRAR